MDSKRELASPNGGWTRRFTVGISVLCSVLLVGLAGVFFASDKTVYVVWWLAVAVTAVTAMITAINGRLPSSESRTKGRLVVGLVAAVAWAGAVALTITLR